MNSHQLPHLVAPSAPAFFPSLPPHQGLATQHQLNAPWLHQLGTGHPQQAYHIHPAALTLPHGYPLVPFNSFASLGHPQLYPTTAHRALLGGHAPSASGSLTSSPMKVDGGVSPLAPWPGYRSVREVNLENAERATNIYVRLLPPEARDSDLQDLGARFGQVLSVRALLSTSIQADNFGIPREETTCKGVGFILYKSPEEAEKAVIGLNAEGFEVSYAKESVSLKLRRLADESSTNLYLTNLPPYFENHDVIQLLSPAVVLSVRILRENDSLPSAERGDGGASKGIGFARLEDRDVADSTIARLNGLHLPGSLLPLRIRYADSREQRQLKQQIGGGRSHRSQGRTPNSGASTPSSPLGRMRPFDSSTESLPRGDTPPSSIFNTPTRVNNASSSMQWTPNVSPASSMNVSPTKPSAQHQTSYFDRPTPPSFFSHFGQNHPGFQSSLKPSPMALDAFNTAHLAHFPAPSPPLDPNFALLAEEEAQAFYGHGPSPLASKERPQHRRGESDELSISTGEGESGSAFSFGSGGAMSGSGSGCVSAGPYKTRFSIGEEGHGKDEISAFKSRMKSGSLASAEVMKEGNGPGSEAWLLRRLESRKSLP